jgi:ubiquitin C-terminal hydrolase
MVGDNRLTCLECQEEQDGTRKLEVERFAPVLIIQFKRTSSSGGWLRKNNASITYPLEFDSDCWANIKTGKYDLTGVIRHNGELGFGHYHCLVKEKSKWYAVSDGSVREVSEEWGDHITDNSAMLLFYQAHSE